MIQFINRRPLYLYRTGDGLERPCAAMADKDFMASGRSPCCAKSKAVRSCFGFFQPGSAPSASSESTASEPYIAAIINAGVVPLGDSASI
jgi:hypothetical protein